MRVPLWAVPAAIVVAAALGIGGARLFAVPSVVVDVAPAAGRVLRTTVFVVDGVKCVDTAERAAAQVKGMAGIVRFVAYASRNRAEITFDPAATNPAAIREAIEGPVYDAASGAFLFHVYHVIEVDGITTAAN